LCYGLEVIFALFGGTKQTKNLNLTEKVHIYRLWYGQFL